MTNRRRPTSAITVPVVLVAALSSLTALTGNPWFILLAGGCVGLVVLALLTPHRLGQLSVTLVGPTRVAVGEALTHHLQVRNEGASDAGPVTLVVSTAGVTVVRVHVDRIPSGTFAQADLVGTATTRGVFSTTTMLLESAAPLGLLCARQARTVSAPLVVHPERVPGLQIQVVRGPGQGTDEPHPGPGPDLAGVREWRTGDEVRRVHWRSTARQGRLVVAERGLDRTEHLHLVVVGPAEAPDWEPLVATAAATVRVAQAEGRRVAVTAWGPAGASASAAGTPGELLDWWAGLRDVTLPDPDALVATRGGHAVAGALLVVASAFVDVGWWAHLERSAARTGLTVGDLLARP